MKITDYQDKELLGLIRQQESIPKMWEESVRRYSSCPAVRENGSVCTYRELDESVCRFRGYLAEKGYRPGATIHIASQRSSGFIKAFLAAQTLGLSVTVLPEGFTENAVTPGEYGQDLSGTDIGVFYPEPHAPAVIMFTGGTTGVPKGAVLSQQCVMVALRNACYGYPNVFEQKYLHVLPMHHVFGLIRSMLTCLATGSELILCPDPRKLFEVAVAETPTISVLVPLLVDRGVTASRKVGKNLFGSAMQTIITGAAPVAAHLAADCRELGITLCPGYGLTETACLVSGNTDMAGHPDSVGLIYPDCETRFVDGELQLRGKNIMTGYTDKSQRSFTEDGWFATGDVGYTDGDGFLYLLGRKKEMLLTANGENVFPAPIESQFNEISEVAECELFEGEDGRLHLEVFPREPELYADPAGQRTRALMAALSRVNEALPKHEKASAITLRLTDFPRTKSLKMVRRGNSNGQI